MYIYVLIYIYFICIHTFISDRMNAFARVYMRPNTHIYTYHKDLRTFITFLLLNFTSSNFRAILFSLPFISPKSLQKQKNAPINEKKAIFLNIVSKFQLSVNLTLIFVIYLETTPEHFIRRLW